MRLQFLGACLAAAALLGGCATAPQNPVPLAGDYFTSPARTGRVGVLVAELPKPDTAFPGADCLLCLAAASLANGDLSKAVVAWPTEELASLKADLAAALRARGDEVVVIDEAPKLADLPDRNGAEPGFARKDFTAYKAKAGVDRLLVVDVQALGAWRNYAAYIPTGAPRAVFKAQAYLVDLSTHKLAWYERVDLGRPAEGNWDEPPAFPGMTNAYFQVLEEGKDAVKRPFAR